MKAAAKKLNRGAMFVSVALFVISFFIFFITSDGNTPYNYFTRLADALIHGRLYLTEAPPWLSELIPTPAGWLVPYSPMPAILALPFVLMFGAAFPQQWVAHLLGAGIVVIAFHLAKRLNPQDRYLPFWAAILSGVGTIMWYEAATGSSWFLGQLTAAFFLFLALLLSQSKKPFWIGMCVGAAYLARLHTILSVPLFIYLVSDIDLFNIKNIRALIRSKAVWTFIAGLAPALLLGAVYNYARFGVMWDKGYVLIPGVLQEPWFSHGIEHPIYIPRNLITAFWSFPKVLPQYPYLQPSWNGLAIWITTPAFIFALLAPIKKRIVTMLWLTISLIFVFVLAHGSNGFAQFGYRFAIDFYPFLTYLVLIGLKDRRLSSIAWTLLFFSVLVNTWGVVWINVFHWVGY